MSCEYEEKETYLFLDFKDKADLNNSNTSKQFLRVTDLDTSCPLVQLNDLLYKGTYENCIGTNLFFTEDESTSSKSCFEEDTSISLKYLLSQNKTLILQCMKIKDSVEDEGSEKADLNWDLNKEYSTTLKQFSNDSLSIEDLFKETQVNSKAELTEKDQIAQTRVEGLQEDYNLNTSGDRKECTESNDSIVEEPILQDPVELEKQLDQISSEKGIGQVASQRLQQKYEKLKELARRPVHRDIEPEEVTGCEDRFKKQFEYHNIERQILQRGDSFPVLHYDINPNTLENGVDIDRCILHDVIRPTIKNQVELSDEEKSKLLRIENFEFLSLPARLCVLEKQAEQLVAFVESAGESDLEKVDEFGRTPQDTLEILKKLINNLKNYLNTLKNSTEESLDIS